MNEPTPEGEPQDTVFGGLELDGKGKKIHAFDSGGGETLTDRELVVLTLLMRARGAEVPKARMETAFQKGYVGSNLYQDLSNTVAHIRRKLARIRGHQLDIAKVRNGGYRLRTNTAIQTNDRGEE